MSECSQVLHAAGKSYPRTCAVCGLGPCQLADPSIEQPGATALPSAASTTAAERLTEVSVKITEYQHALMLAQGTTDHVAKAALCGLLADCYTEARQIYTEAAYAKP